MNELELVQNCRRDGAAVVTRDSYIDPFVSVQNKWNTLKHYIDRNCSNIIPYKPPNEDCDYNTTMDVT